MAEKNYFDRYDTIQPSLPAAELKPLIAAPEKPEKPEKPTETFRLATTDEKKQAGLDPNRAYQINEVTGEFKDIGGQPATKPQTVDPNKAFKLNSALDTLENIKQLSGKMFSVGEQAGRLRDTPVIGSLVGQNRADLEGNLSLIEGILIQDQLENLARINPQGISSLANAESEARRLASSIANLDPNQSQEQFLMGVKRAEEYFKNQMNQFGVERKPLIPVPEVAPAGEVAPVAAGEKMQTEQDIDKQRQLQMAWNSGANVDQMVQLAQQLQIRPFSEDEIAVMRSQFEKKGPVRFFVDPTGDVSTVGGAAGAILGTETGENIGAYTTGAANMLLGSYLDELAPVLGLSETQVRAGKDYLRKQAPVSSFAGEVTGSVLASIPAVKTAQTVLAPTRFAPAAPLVGETILGGITGSGEAQPGDRLLGGIIGAGTAGTATAAVNRLLPGGPGTFTGMPADGPSIRTGGGGGAGGFGGGPRGSVGAMSVDEATIRAERAAELPVPIELARFQRTRDFTEQQRARELAKNNEVGGPIRERMTQQQDALRQNFERFIEGTGSEVWNNPYEQGGVIADALSTLAKRERTRINALYKRAEKAGEMREPVSYAQLTDFINQQTPTTREKLAPVLKSIEEQLLANDPNKTGMIALNQMEDIRKLINKLASPGTPDMAFGKEMRGIIDDITKDAGGDVYQSARRARQKYAQDFEDIDLVQKVFDNKPGTKERYIALEKVVDRITGESAPLDSVNHLLGLLDRAGPRGAKAKRELQGSLMEKIRDQAYRGVTRDESGNVVVQPAALNSIIKSLDKSGKLDAIFDKPTAELLRTANSVAQDMFTAPPGSINASNTSSALLNAIDTIATFMLTQLPIPSGRITKELRDSIETRKLQKEVKRLLE